MIEPILSFRQLYGFNKLCLHVDEGASGFVLPDFLVSYPNFLVACGHAGRIVLRRRAHLIDAGIFAQRMCAV